MDFVSFSLAGSSSATGQNVGEDEEADYVPDDGENSIDDETTLEEQEAMENEGDIADEVAALQEVRIRNCHWPDLGFR